MDLPTEEQCLDYFKQYKVPPHIMAHCLKVKEVAFFLATQLQNNDIAVNLDFVRSLALLHDLFKTVTFPELKSSKLYPHEYSSEEIAVWQELRKKFAGKYESEIASEVFKDIYPELALSLKNVSSPKHTDPSMEEMLVHYADLRVLQERIVSVLERMEYLMGRYQNKEEYWEAFFAALKEKEQKIFSHLDFSPRELAAEMRGLNNGQ